MGERLKRPLRVNYDRQIQIEFHGVKVTSDAGLLAYRELDDVFELTEMVDNKFFDRRTGKNTLHSMKALLRQSVFGRLAGYEDTNDATRLRIDPAMRQVVGERGKEHFLASTSEMGRFETDMLTHDKNLKTLESLSGDWVKKITERTGMKELILDMDSSVSPTYGNQDGSKYNGHFGCNCYHPLFCFNQYGDLLGSSLRDGNVYSSTDWDKQLLPILEKYRSLKIPKYFRGDAAFGKPEIYEALESEDYLYAIRLKSNNNLIKEIDFLLTRPDDFPSSKPKVFYHSFTYQADTWKKARRVVAKLEWHIEELFPRVGFIVTNLKSTKKNVVKFYNKRGTAEQWIKEGKYAINWTRLSCHDFKDNQVRLQLFSLAYNLGNFLRRLVLPRKIKHWTLTTLREKFIKIGAKVISHSRYVIFQMAEVAISKELMAKILENINRLRLNPDTS